jgi:hypothetical protein
LSIAATRTSNHSGTYRKDATTPHGRHACIAEPSQQRFVAQLEVEWVNLFKVSGSSAKVHASNLDNGISILLTEIDTLLFLHPYEKRLLARAQRLLRLNKYNASLVAVHPLIHGRVSRPYDQADFSEQIPRWLDRKFLVDRL